MNHEDTEYNKVERPTIELFKKLGWTHIYCHNETYGPGAMLGREASSEVVLTRLLRASLQKLNPNASPEAIALAIEELTHDRHLLTIANANRELYKLLKDGVKVPVTGEEGETVEVVRIIDWDNPQENDFLLCSQLWISGDMYNRRADLVGFVNGLPLLFIELKSSHKRLEHAYSHNLSDYKDTIPHIFWPNAVIILSNGSESRIGSVTAEWEHFAEWKKISDESEKGVVSLETMVRGTCEKSRFLDLVENFTLFVDVKGGVAKMLAKNHQYLGVNNAIEAVKKIRQNQGRLGVFWHTQGSGKSYSMVFSSQKILRKLPGNWTFLVVTDRDELDGQIYRNFATAGAVTEAEERVRAQSGAHLKDLLREDHRYLFTLIQKFRTEKGEKYPKLSDRPNIIVMTDEAHRTQYDIFALNMRNALPNAAFIGFTGTPLIAGEEKTRDVFGDYVSIYNFKQSADDKNTVRLFYENRIPEMQLTNENLNEDMEQLLEEAELDENQEIKLEREFAREYHLITREERLERIAKDIARHFPERGFHGKGMVVSIDKATAIRMYDKVKMYWSQYLKELLGRFAKAATDDERADFKEKIKFMETTEMAVVVSQSQGEIEEFRKKGLDILTHRKRMKTEDLETKFKDAEDPFRLVFVCAMWMTGFDAPSCSTIYLDKPMKNHTLMQTIARANRVFKEKPDGLIVDYVGVFRNLQKALAIYGAGGGIGPGETPVEPKGKLVEELRAAIAEGTSFCKKQGVDLDQIEPSSGFERVRLEDDAVDALVSSDETRRTYLSHARTIDILFRAILPDPSVNEFGSTRRIFVVLAEKIRSLTPEADVSEVMQAVEDLLDKSVATEGYVIRDGSDRKVDLSQIDFEALKKRFANGRKYVEAEKLKGQLSQKLKEMVRQNRARMDYLKKFQEMIEEYNSGSCNIEAFFKMLTEFAKNLSNEEQRAIKEYLSEEELALFDILTRPDMHLTDKEKKEVKKVARELLETLKQEKLVLDWRKRQQSRAQVRLTVEQLLDRLPPKYTRQVFAEKCNVVYQHIYDSYYGENRSVYAVRY